MKISVITVVFNAHATIADTLGSIAAQDYPHVEHIVVDGGSTDGTLEIIEPYKNQIKHFVSEPDQGIYDAMNKGIQLATGDVIGLLNADDVYADNTVLSQVAKAHADSNLDAVYANLVYVATDDLYKVVRDWQSRDHTPGLCFKGWMPAHPTLYLKREVYDRVGLFNSSLRYQSDLEFCARAFEVHKISSRYIPKLWVRMRVGGATNNSLINMFKGNWESYKALRELGLRRDPISYFIIKLGAKLPQFLRAKRQS